MPIQKQRPLRIGIEAQRLFRQHKHGMDIVVLELIRSLQAIDIFNQYFIFVKPDEDRNCIRRTDNFSIIEVKGISYPDWEQIHLPKAARRYALDVLHCTSNTAPLFGIKNLFLTLHDVIFLEKNYLLAKEGGSLYQRFGNVYRSLVVPRIVKKAKKIFTVSSFQQQAIAKTLSLPEKKIQVLYNGVNAGFFTKVDESQLAAIKKKYKLPEYYIFFLGNTEPRKNLKGVLNAYALATADIDLPPLVIKGIKEEFLMANLHDLGVTHIRQHITLVGYIDAADLPGLYQGAKVVLFPSFSEGFGIPIIEAMAGGIPVITSNISCMPEVASDAAILIDPYQPRQISDALIQLLSKPVLYQQYREKGFTRAKIFSWDNSARELLKAYGTFL